MPPPPPPCPPPGTIVSAAEATFEANFCFACSARRVVIGRRDEEAKSLSASEQADSYRESGRLWPPNQFDGIHRSAEFAVRENVGGLEVARGAYKVYVRRLTNTRAVAIYKIRFPRSVSDFNI